MIDNFLLTPPTPDQEKLWVEELRAVFSDFQEELDASLGSNLLVSDVRTTYSKAQATCREMGMNLGNVEVRETYLTTFFSDNFIKRETERGYRHYQ